LPMIQARDRRAAESLVKWRGGAPRVSFYGKNNN